VKDEWSDYLSGMEGNPCPKCGNPLHEYIRQGAAGPMRVIVCYTVCNYVDRATVTHDEILKIRAAKKIQAMKDKEAARGQINMLDF